MKTNVMEVLKKQKSELEELIDGVESELSKFSDNDEDESSKTEFRLSKQKELLTHILEKINKAISRSDFFNN